MAIRAWPRAAIDSGSVTGFGYRQCLTLLVQAFMDACCCWS